MPMKTLLQKCGSVLWLHLRGCLEIRSLWLARCPLEAIARGFFSSWLPSGNNTSTRYAGRLASSPIVRCTRVYGASKPSRTRKSWEQNRAKVRATWWRTSGIVVISHSNAAPIDGSLNVTSSRMHLQNADEVRSIDSALLSFLLLNHWLGGCTK